MDLSPNDPQLWAFCTYGALVLIFKQDFKQAVEWAERASNIPNHQYWTAAHKLVAHAHLGDQKNVEITRAKLLDEVPKFTCEFAREKLFYIKDQNQIDIYLTGIRKAGIPKI